MCGRSINQSTSQKRSSLDEVGSSETDNGQKTSDCVHGSTGGHRLGNIGAGRLVVIVRTRGAVTTVAALASTVAALVAIAVTVAATVVVAAVGAVIVTRLLALRSLSTLGTGVRRRRGNTGRVSTARRNGVAPFAVSLLNRLY